MRMSAAQIKLLNAVSWAFNVLVILYFCYISWWAAVDFNGFTSMIFGIPILAILLGCAYLAGFVSSRQDKGNKFTNYGSQAILVGLTLFYLSGFFPSLQDFTNLPIRIATKISKISTGKTPDQWVRELSR